MLHLSQSLAEASPLLIESSLKTVEYEDNVEHHNAKIKQRRKFQKKAQLQTTKKQYICFLNLHDDTSETTSSDLQEIDSSQ